MNTLCAMLMMYGKNVWTMCSKDYVKLAESNIE